MRVLGEDTGSVGAGPGGRRRAGDAVFLAVVTGAVGFGLWQLVSYTIAKSGLGVYVTALGLGFVTFLRVVFLLVVATLVWVPVGVKIGQTPRLARTAQPIVQVLASFPANFLFPFATLFFLETGISLNVGAVLLMALGAQWYILFNTIAGAQAIPSDLREAMDNLHIRGWQRWKRLIIPAIFPFYVTGAITASGGAWNASIVAEIVTFRGKTLTATGLGAYIAKAFSATDPGHRRPAPRGGGGHEPLRRRGQPGGLAPAVQTRRAPVQTGLKEVSPWQCRRAPRPPRSGRWCRCWPAAG